MNEIGPFFGGLEKEGLSVKIHVKLPESFSQRPQQSKKNNLCSKIGCIILCLLPGLLVLTVGLIFIELWTPMRRLSTPILMLSYLFVIWCSFSAVVLAGIAKKWLPTFITCIVLLIVVILIK